MLVHLRIVPTVISEDLHREGTGGPRIIGQGTNTVAYVALDDDAWATISSSSITPRASSVGAKP